MEFANLPGAALDVLPVKVGLGGVPLGNEFELVSDEDAYKTLEAAWNAGVRYYDVAPWYGLGLAERRYGNFLHNKNRDDYRSGSQIGAELRRHSAQPLSARRAGTRPDRTPA
jgi:aryl-alcohol dehydrogenase-like predicted oxidoreductase